MTCKTCGPKVYLSSINYYSYILSFSYCNLLEFTDGKSNAIIDRSRERPGNNFGRGIVPALAGAGVYTMLYVVSRRHSLVGHLRPHFSCNCRQSCYVMPSVT